MFIEATFITQGGEGRGKTNKKRKATKSKGRGLDLRPSASQELFDIGGFPELIFFGSILAKNADILRHILVRRIDLYQEGLPKFQPTKGEDGVRKGCPGGP